MKLHIAGIDWDDGNRHKCQKHGLTIAEIEAFFAEEKYRVIADSKHSNQTEQRFIAVGRSKERLLFLGFTFRAKETGIMVRPISARYMREKEAQKLW